MPLISKIVFCLLVLLTFPLHAVSFDCKKASSYVEQLICIEPGLSKLDSQVAEAYFAKKSKSASPEVELQSQRAWLRQRNQCDSIPCLRRSYESRLAALRLNEVSPSIAPESPPASSAVPSSETNSVQANLAKARNAQQQALSAKQEEEKIIAYRGIQIASLHSRLINLNFELFTSLMQSGIEMDSTTPFTNGVQASYRELGIVRFWTKEREDGLFYEMYEMGSRSSGFLPKGLLLPVQVSGRLLDNAFEEDGAFSPSCVFRVHLGKHSQRDYNCQAFMSGQLSEQVFKDLVEMVTVHFEKSTKQ